MSWTGAFTPALFGPDLLTFQFSSNQMNNPESASDHSPDLQTKRGGLGPDQREPWFSSCLVLNTFFETNTYQMICSHGPRLDKTLKCYSEVMFYHINIVDLEGSDAWVKYEIAHCDESTDNLNPTGRFSSTGNLPSFKPLTWSLSPAVLIHSHCCHPCGFQMPAAVLSEVLL